MANVRLATENMYEVSHALTVHSVGQEGDVDR